jgi:hypothetical protein
MDTLHGHHRAHHSRMPSVSDSDGWSRVERLVEELRAIERWDANYWRNRYLDAYEMLAFAARRERRAEILSQLLTLIPPLVIGGRSYGLSGNRANKQRGKPASEEAQLRRRGDS